MLDQLIDQGRQLGISNRVFFIGFQRNPWPYLKHADLFVLPSRYEGLPNALLEALALGVSVVATNCPSGIAEVAAQYPGINLVPPEDADALAAELITVLLKTGLLEKGQLPTRMTDTFGLEQAITQYSSLFSS